MILGSIAALAIALFVAGPLVAHMLRRRSADEVLFAAVKLVPKSPPAARKRSRIDDRSLFVVRALSIVLLAVLGATPFVRVRGLSLARERGASLAVAIVVDDSLSMLARDGGESPWSRAISGANDLADALAPGDAALIVLAGAPPRVALAPTSDAGAVRAALASLTPSHRATDLDAALALAGSLVGPLPQADKRVVLLSDLRDGASGGALAGEVGGARVWAPLAPAPLAAPPKDCAVLRAEARRDRVTARVLCTDAAAATGRKLGLLAGERVLATAAIGAGAGAADVVLDRVDATAATEVALDGADAIADDDRAPVLASSGALAVAVLADANVDRVATGGASVTEQALAALGNDVEVRPIPLVPEGADGLAPYGVLVLDDPPGLTPEARRALSTWLDKGGVALLALGPRAAAAPLGAGFAPLVPGTLRWAATSAKGLDRARSAFFGASAAGLDALAPRGRVALGELAGVEGADVVAAFDDGEPAIVRRAVRRGLALVVALPFSPDESELALRPAFLSLLSGAIDEARARGGSARIEAGAAWSFDDAASLAVVDAKGEQLAVTKQRGRALVTPARAGAYAVTVDGATERRVVDVPERELDFRVRETAPAGASAPHGETRPLVDVSKWIAAALLALFVAELAMRLVARREARQDGSSSADARA